MNMQMVARSLLIYRITGSGAILGLMALANAIPMLLLTLPGGVIADRIQKKTIIQIGQVASAVVSLINTIALATGYLSPDHPNSWWVLMVCTFIQGGVMGFMMPSRSAIISEIVGTEHLMNAISLNNLGMNVFRLLAPALAGFLIDAFGFYVVFSINTAMYLMATLCIVFVPASEAGRAQGSSSLDDVVESWRYIRREKTIFIVLVFTVTATVLGMPYAQLLPMFTEGILKVDATAMGVLISVSGAGAILGSLIIASLANRKRGLIMLIGGLVMSLALMVFAFSHWWYLSLFIILFIGMGNTGQMALGNSLIQYYVDATYRGRVMSFFTLGFGFGSLGAFFAGIVAEAVGVQWAVGGMAIILVVICITVLSMAPRLRKLD
jgi:MFS family permease